jgi:hypothetical protein
MSLIEISDKSQSKQIQSKLKKIVLSFINFLLDLKLKQLINYIQKRVLKELGVVAVENIERIDEEIELRQQN